MTRLLAAFFFRQHGQRPSGDPTFIFTHKSFGEHFIAKRLVRAMERIVRETNSKQNAPDGGWDEREALKHCAQICGPSPMTHYLYSFLKNELCTQTTEVVVRWQNRFSQLLSYAVKHGMPMELLQLNSFREAMLWSRNAEEALLVAMNACASVTRHRNILETADPSAFGSWFKRIQGQRSTAEPVIVAACLSVLNLSGAHLHMADLCRATLHDSDLARIEAPYSCWVDADLRNADLSFARLSHANLEGANPREANLEGVHLDEASLKGANLSKANMRGADLGYANLEQANLREAILRGARLEGAKLKGADLYNTDLGIVNLRGAANLEDADLMKAYLQGAELSEEDLRRIEHGRS